MPDPDRHLPEEIRWEGRFIAAKTRGKWEYVARTRGVHAAVLLAVDESGGDGPHVLLVEQYRVPLGRQTLELPAGLVGDEQEGEALLSAAARELEEETGYRAERIEVLGEFAASPGMTSETFTLVRCHGLARVGAGGGVADEEITVRRVALDALPAFVAERRAAGLMMDVKLLALLGAGWLAA